MDRCLCWFNLSNTIASGLALASTHTLTVLKMKTKDLHPGFSIWSSLSKKQRDICIAESQRRKANNPTPAPGNNFANRRINEIQVKRNGNGDNDGNNDSASGTASDPHAPRGSANIAKISY